MNHQEQILKLNKNKRVYGFSITDFYDDYATDRKDIKHLTRQQYCRIMKKLFREMAREIMHTLVPYNPRIGLGRFGIVKQLRKTKPIDWKLTRQLGKVIYHKNSYTNGNVFKWHWEKKHKCFFANKGLYTFTPVRSLKRELASYIKGLDKDPTKKPFDALTHLPPYEN